MLGACDSVGSADGMDDGLDDGVNVGASLGDGDGAGLLVGSSDGDIVGKCDGPGSNVGASLGDGDGAGLLVGSSVGPTGSNVMGSVFTLGSLLFLPLFILMPCPGGSRASASETASPLFA